MGREGTFQIANTLSKENYDFYKKAFESDKQTKATSLSAWILEQTKMNIKRREFLKNNYNDYRVVSYAENMLMVEVAKDKKIIVVKLVGGQVEINQHHNYSAAENLNVANFALATPEFMMLEDPVSKK